MSLDPFLLSSISRLVMPYFQTNQKGGSKRPEARSPRFSPSSTPMNLSLLFLPLTFTLRTLYLQPLIIYIKPKLLKRCWRVNIRSMKFAPLLLPPPPACHPIPLFSSIHYLKPENDLKTFFLESTRGTDWGGGREERKGKKGADFRPCWGRVWGGPAGTFFWGGSFF